MKSVRLWQPWAEPPIWIERGNRTREVCGRDQAAFFCAALSSITPMMSDSFMIRRSSPSMRTSVPDHLPNRMRSPTWTSSALTLPFSSRAPGPTAITSPSWGFSFGVRDDDAAPGLLLRIDAADHNTVVQGTKLHELLSVASYRMGTERDRRGGVLL